MFVFKAAVVGAGTMGGQIAQTIAAAGFPVVLKDINQDLVQAGLDEARKVTEGQVAKLVKKERITAEQGAAQIEEILGRIEGTTSYAGFGDVDFVIEAVPERMEIKQAVFAELDAVTPGHAILASNTSSLSIGEIGEATLRPDKVVGFHYFYPASVMPLVEIVEGEETSPETVTAALTFAQAIRKQPIACLEVPGFVVNRILMAGMSELWREQEEKKLSIKAIDEGVGSAGVVPMGPYFLVNLLGLDTVLHVAEHVADAYGDERFYVPKGMQKLVSEGKLGAKTGGDGVYSPSGEANLKGDADPDVAELVELLTLKTFVEAALVLQEGVATHRDIDFGMMAGAGLDPRRGLMPPFMKADMEGLDSVLERLENAAERYGERFAPPDDPAAPGRPGPARPEERPGLLRLPPARRRAAGRGGQARDAPRRRGDRVACQRPDELDLPAGDRGPRQGLGARSRTRDVHCARDRLLQPVPVQRGRRHQGVHLDGRRVRGGDDPRRPCALARIRLGGDRDDRRRQRARLRRWLRARDGLRRAHRRALGDLRPAGDQARDHPRLRRHPTPATARRARTRPWR